MRKTMERGPRAPGTSLSAGAKAGGPGFARINPAPGAGSSSEVDSAHVGAYRTLPTSYSLNACDSKTFCCTLVVSNSCHPMN